MGWVCFTLPVDPARLDEYPKRHARARFFVDGQADETRTVLGEVFNLDAQLSEAGRNGDAR